MAKSNDMTIYTYRYIWKTNDSKKDMFNVKYITGAEVEHKAFMGKLQKDETVVSATRIYVNEINVSLTEQYEFIKKEKK